MWLGCHEFPNEIDPIMSSSSMLNLDVGMMPIIFPVGTGWVVFLYVCVCFFNNKSATKSPIKDRDTI